jgi:hypothetical protein
MTGEEMERSNEDPCSRVVELAPHKQNASNRDRTLDHPPHSHKFFSILDYNPTVGRIDSRGC